MASQQIIKRRITSVGNTRQITKAMQLVAASKLRRAQDAAVGPKAYISVAREVLEGLSKTAEARQNPLFQTRDNVKTVLTIIITSDRGLAGAYNANVVRSFIKSALGDSLQHQTICVGKYVTNILTRTKGVETLATFHNEDPLDIIQPVYRAAVDAYTEGRVDEVRILYTKFISTVRQEIIRERLLPVTPPDDEGLQPRALEPNAEELLDTTLHRLLEAQVLQAIYEAQASEQASRMLAMKNATDNATELIADLTLEANKARQASITQELAEISAGAEAMK